MAVAGLNILVNQNTAGASSYTTASFTPSVNTLYLATVVTRTGITADPNQPTCTGAGLTWVVVSSIVFDTTSSSRRRITVFRALGIGSIGALTFDYATQAQTINVWSIDAFTGINTSGTNGSGAIVQAVPAKDETLTPTAFAVTLAAFSNASNATFGAFGTGDPGAQVIITQGSGYTQLTDFDAVNAQGLHMSTQWQATNNTNVNITTNTNNFEFGGIGVEIAAASATSIATPGYFITYNPTFLS